MLPVADAMRAFRRKAWTWFAPRTSPPKGTRVLKRVRGEQASAFPHGDVVRSHLKGVLEAIIFASEHPQPARDLARIAQADLRDVKAILAELVGEYRERGFRLDEVAGGFVFRTSPGFAPFVREQASKKPVKMTRAQLETLAIVAYRQPITRPEVDDVRGVDSGAVLKSLLERDLVRILGKKDEPGRPMLYATTTTFLELFGLRAISDLPTLRELTELTEESRQTYERALGVEAPRSLSGASTRGLAGAEGEIRAGAGSSRAAHPAEASSEGPADAADPVGTGLPGEASSREDAARPNDDEAGA
jgi:segregation and condensation protein B